MPTQKAIIVPLARGFVQTWTDYLSPYALPTFSAERRAEIAGAMIRGDLLLIALLLASIIGLATFPEAGHTLRRVLLTGLAVYRLIDIAVVLLNIGIFGSIRHDSELHELPRHHLHRILIATVMAYCELMFWFALLYFAVAAAHPDQFDAPIHTRTQAFALSVSTMTTTGDSKNIPIGPIALGLVAIQATLGLSIYAIVIGSVVGSLKEASDEKEEAISGYKRYVTHMLTPFAAYLCCCGLATLLI